MVTGPDPWVLLLVLVVFPVVGAMATFVILTLPPAVRDVVVSVLAVLVVCFVPVGVF
jgi:hypothetical protein